MSPTTAFSRTRHRPSNYPNNPLEHWDLSTRGSPLCYPPFTSVCGCDVPSVCHEISNEGLASTKRSPHRQWCLSVAETVRSVRLSPSTSGISSNWRPTSPVQSGWLWAVLASPVHLSCTTHANRAKVSIGQSQPTERVQNRVAVP